MTELVEGPVTVTVPATSANLGPGFDCLGLALDLRDELTAELGGDGLVVEVTGEGADSLVLDESHLVVRAMDTAFAAMGMSLPPLRLSCVNRIPHARGLGSSSAAIVGGLALARALVAEPARRLADEDLLALANALEGHPDNVAPALHGGFVISGQDEDSVWADQAPVDPRVETVAFVPPHRLDTAVARGLLPSTVSHRDAAANTGRAALLVAALAAAPDRLLRATEDFLHQQQRRPAMPDSLALVDALRADGVATVVSGAGPTVLALVVEGHGEDLVRRTPPGWRALPLAVSREGVRVE